ncbi:MAG: HTH domain-containing protein [Firmicutes bacterium]|nr:HTH domain-containing protein [Bacillota bacterium]
MVIFQSTTTLAEEFNVSVRTIQRDINSLTIVGISIVSYHGSSRK